MVGQAILAQRVGEEVAIEEHPRRAFAMELVVEERHEFLPECGGAGAGLARQGDKGVDFLMRTGGVDGARRAKARVQDGEALIEVSMRSHGAMGSGRKPG